MNFVTHVKEIGVRLIVHINKKALEEGINPWDYGTQKCCTFLKTQALLDAISEGGFDAASVEHVAMRKNPEQRKEYFHSVTVTVSGTLKTSVPSSGIFTTVVTIRENPYECFRSRTGQNSTYGITYIGRKFP